ncbi:transglycosylase SLT domain-containing protein [Aureimonas fodinaquatilis]|uniref:Transglycosylase SLT domain-containing protein n=2 Tax=Aureimonas fodinaquatilis TaxID=2565783 RepID=A0A5B0E306_9HYPH|nr:transglycosylase SLT domain-containing protein [Aureimonas fodinaquatilis]
MIARAADANNIPRELAYAVVHVESRYNPDAKGRGVYGLSQIKPATARSMGFSGPDSALFDPETNLRYGMKYLAGAWEQGGQDICNASMKYKGGHRATTMTQSARTYCSNVKRHMAAINSGTVNSGKSSRVAKAAAPAKPEVQETRVAAVAKPVLAAQTTTTNALAPASKTIAPAAKAIVVATSVPMPEHRPGTHPVAAAAPQGANPSHGIATAASAAMQSFSHVPIPQSANSFNIRN